MRNIDLSLNSLSGTIPLSLGDLLELQELMISNYNVSDSIPTTLSNAKNLQQLQVNTIKLSGLILKYELIVKGDAIFLI